MAKRIVFFNHKGGVSKTTSVYNLGWILANGHRVLVVDGDPQCNLSSLILGERFEEYYTNPLTQKQNLKDGVEVAFKGKPQPIMPVSCVTPDRSANLFLLAGHADLSAYEASLTFAQTSGNALATLQNLPGAFSELIRLCEEKYNIDYTLIDLNPGLSSINQNLFLSADAFVIPTNPDPFSIMAIDTLKEVLPRWMEWKQNNLDFFEDSAYPLRNSQTKFLGMLIQRFNIRKGKAARPYRDNIAEIKRKVLDDLVPRLQSVGMAFNLNQYPHELIEEKFCLSEIPDFQGLLPKSYAAEVPVFALRDEDIQETGPVLEQMSSKRDMFKAQFNELSEKILRTLDNV
ncbi:chromosome partitioning protein ParA [Pantoea ananatis]|uniref:ParA family protein n=1 Tax=Pantoea ananas TaxID=553 RepID=UPI001EE5FD05|nr:ParA family protein [Pantoea ananatis]MDC7870664.1 chromosome partitioning protein ParA [Pantoea ananatis]PKC47782.1 chromosome partitioning protein ParA [Pantoea ananatis BRT98]